MGLKQSHRRTPELLIQEVKRQQILTYETVSLPAYRILQLYHKACGNMKLS